MDEKELTALIDKASEAGRKEIEKMSKRRLSAKELEIFKKEVYNYLTQKLGASITTANELMESYEIGFERYLEDNWDVSAVATAMWYGY